MAEKTKPYRVTMTVDGGESKIWVEVWALTKEGAMRKAKRQIDILSCEEIEE